MHDNFAGSHPFFPSGVEGAANWTSVSTCEHVIVSTCAPVCVCVCESSVRAHAPIENAPVCVWLLNSLSLLHHLLPALFLRNVHMPPPLLLALPPEGVPRRRGAPGRQRDCLPHSLQMVVRPGAKGPVGRPVHPCCTHPGEKGWWASKARRHHHRGGAAAPRRGPGDHDAGSDA